MISPSTTTADVGGSVFRLSNFSIHNADLLKNKLKNPEEKVEKLQQKKRDQASLNFSDPHHMINCREVPSLSHSIFLQNFVSNELVQLIYCPFSFLNFGVFLLYSACTVFQATSALETKCSCKNIKRKLSTITPTEDAQKSFESCFISSLSLSMHRTG